MDLGNLIRVRREMSSGKRVGMDDHPFEYAPHLQHVFDDADPPPLGVVYGRSVSDGGIGDHVAQILRIHRVSQIGREDAPASRRPPFGRRHGSPLTVAAPGRRPSPEAQSDDLRRTRDGDLALGRPTPHDIPAAVVGHLARQPGVIPALEAATGNSVRLTQLNP